MGPHAEVDYKLTLCPLQTRLQHIYFGQRYARVDFISQSGTLDLPSGFLKGIFNLDVNSFSLIYQSLRFHGVNDNGDHRLGIKIMQERLCLTDETG